MSDEHVEGSQSDEKDSAPPALRKAPPEVIFNHFSSSPSTLVYEHGLPQRTPFLVRPFRGASGIREYFDLLSKYPWFEKMASSNYVVDTQQMKGWDDVFTYVLELDQEQKVKVYEVWADSGAAYLASRGELEGQKTG